MNRHPGIDTIKVIAIFSIIATHTTSAVIYNVMYNTNWGWTAMFDAITRPGVLLFVMASGALTLGRKINILDSYKKIFFRIIIPLVAWSFIYYIFNIDFEQLSIKEFFINLITGKDYFHLWYLHMIIGVFLSAPFLNMIYIKSSKKEKLCFILAGIFLSSIIPFVSRCTGIQIQTGEHIFVIFCITFFCGRFLFDEEISNKVIIFFGVLSIILILVNTFGTINFKIETGSYNNLFISNSLPFNILLAICFFCIFKGVNHKESIAKAISTVSKLTLGIYASHILIRDLFMTNKYLLTLNNIFNMDFIIGIGTVINALIVLVITTALVLILSRIPIVRRIT